MKRRCIISSLLLWKPAAGQNCTICQGNRTALDPDQPLNKGGSCGEVDALVRTLSTEECDEKEIDIIVSGIRCGCRDDDQFPVCGIRQNPSCKSLSRGYSSDTIMVLILLLEILTILFTMFRCFA